MTLDTVIEFWVSIDSKFMLNQGTQLTQRYYVFVELCYLEQLSLLKKQTKKNNLEQLMQNTQ